METNNENVIDIIGLFKRCLRNWYWFVLCAGLCGIIAVLYVLSTPKKYEVHATVMLRQDGGGGMLSKLQSMDMTSLISLGGGTSILVEDEMQIVASRNVMRQVVEKLDIQTQYWKKNRLRWLGQYGKDAELKVSYPPMFEDTVSKPVKMKLRFNGEKYKLKIKYGKQETQKFILNDLSEPVQTDFGVIRFETYMPIEAGSRYKILTLPMNERVDKLRKEISASAVKKGSSIVVVATKSDVPPMACDIITQMLEIYTEQVMIDKNQKVTLTKQVIDERLQLAAVELEKIETAVENYKKDNSITSLSDEASLYVLTQSEYQKQMVEIETQMNLVDYIKAFVQDANNAHAMIPASQGLQDVSLLKLIESYNHLLLRSLRLQRSATDDNPTYNNLEAQIVETRRNIVASVESVRDGLQIMKNDLQQQESRYGSRIHDVPTREKEYVQIKREQSVKQQVYLFLYQKREEAVLEMASVVMPIRMIDVAQASYRHVAPRGMLTLLIALILGCLIPFTVIFIQEWMFPQENKKQE